MLLLLLLRRLCLAPARWALLRLLAPVPRLPLQVLFLLRMRLCPASRSGFLPLSEPFGVYLTCAFGRSQKPFSAHSASRASRSCIVLSDTPRLVQICRVLLRPPSLTHTCCHIRAVAQTYLATLPLTVSILGLH